MAEKSRKKVTMDTTQPAPRLPSEDQAAAPRRGLTMKRYFTRPGVHPYNEVEWEKRSAVISGEKGETVFEQLDVEIPKPWSQLATNVVVSKYFRGQLGTPQREQSVKQLIGRVVDTVTNWGRKDGYFTTEEDASIFSEELTHLLLHQKLAFNSPVWFNVGVEPHPQCSACQPYHALINTVFGPMPIGEIVEKEMIGLPVYDENGLTQVVAVKHNGQKPVYRVQLNDGFSVEATGDHLVCAHDVRRTQTLQWMRVDELRPGMVMRVYPHTPETITPPGSEIEISEAALAGWLQADGFVGQYEEGTNRSLTLEFMTANEGEFQWVMQHLDKVFPNHHSHTREVETKSDKLHVQRIRLYGEALRPFVERYDLLRRKTEIRVPERLWTASNDAVIAYLKSVFQADGYVTVQAPSARIGVATISQTWMAELQVLLTRVGIYSRLRKKEEKREDRLDLWDLDIAILSERLQFAQRIGFLSEPKQAVLQESLDLSGKDCPEVRFSTIETISPIGGMDVYDIQTLSSHYLTNAVLVHNCFILSVEDKMDSILDWYRKEGVIFKGGSGSGVNLSKIRSSRERLAGGGTASGPVSFMRAADASAGVIKSGGKTRRAAKMVVLDADHPDIGEFIQCKAEEEKKAWTLIDAGYDGSIDGAAYNSVFFQNANNSVRVTDEFMKAVIEDRTWSTRYITTGEICETVRARDLLQRICGATWQCGDPGMQFDTTINAWHTCPNTDRINASNPCAEYMHLDNSACMGPEVRISTKQGLLPVAELYRRQEAGEPIFVKTELLSEHAAVPRQGKRGYRPADVHARQLAFRPAVVIKTGRKLLYQIELSTGQKIRLTADHKVLTEEGWKEVRDLQVGADAIVTQKQSTPLDYSEATREEINFHHMLGWMLGDGYCSQDGQRPAFGLVFGPQDKATADYLLPVFNHFVGEHTQARTKTISISTQANGVMQIGSTAQGAFQTLVAEHGVQPAVAPWKCVPTRIFTASKVLQAAFLGALFSADGSIFLRDSHDQDSHLLLVRLASSSPQLLSDTQLLLFDFGIRSSITWTHPDGRKNPQGTLSIHGYHAYKFCQMIGFPLAEQKQAKAQQVLNQPFEGNNYAGRRAVIKQIQESGADDVYDISEPVTHSMLAEGMIIHNCNLASLNLLKFMRDDSGFDTVAFKHAVDISITAQDILVDNSSYPTEEITANARAFRQLGLGYANLGALLMSLGLPYDSEAGRQYSGAITALMTGEGYLQSARIAEQMGAFSGYAVNREPMLDVIDKHRSYAHTLDPSLVPLDLLSDARKSWEEALALGRKAGYRNSQATVLAPTGTISFLMDCDTTGVEPDIALVKYKRLVGGGMLKIVNHTVPRALKRLGYDNTEIQDILEYIDEHETIEGAPLLRDEHLAVFDCAFKPNRGVRTIHYLGHVRMMGAVQPFLSGAISKTINMPTEATVLDISEAYMESWRLGLKAVAIYRDGCKRIQPLGTGNKKALTQPVPVVIADPEPTRRRLPMDRQAICHKFDIAGHEGYIHVGFYEDGTPGEIFIKMAKEGSTISGLMDTIATLTSLALQYGVPLEALVSKFGHVRFEPSGFTQNPDIPYAKSLTDYIFRFLGTRFLAKDPRQEAGPEEQSDHRESSRGTLEHAQTLGPQEQARAPLNGSTKSSTASTAPLTRSSHPSHGDSLRSASLAAQQAGASLSMTWQSQSDAPSCADCGSIMIRNGACYKCLNCGATSGCS